MARRLPWASDASAADTTQAVKRKRTSVQPRRHEQPLSSDDDLASKPKRHQTSSPMNSPIAREPKREISRTPSTSPPPAPPPTELMHEGYHADDLFMMVEDEFQAVAQTFTHHLHHAEYVRMKKKARVAASPVSMKTTNSLRPETKKKLEAKDIHDRQNIAVEGMAGRGGRASPDDEEEAQGNDPWQGTSLAGLMAKDGAQKKRALVGLEPIPSTTRAAKGFSRGEGDSPTKREENRSILEIYGDKARKGRTTSPTSTAPTEDADTSEDDDLDTSPRIKPVMKHMNPEPSEIRKALKKNDRIDPVQPSSTLITSLSPPNSRPENMTRTKVSSNALQSSSRFSSSSLRRKIDSFDDSHDEDSDKFSNWSRSDFSSKSNTRTKEKPANENEKRSRLNEIPTFLV